MPTMTWKPWKPVAMKKVEPVDIVRRSRTARGIFIGLDAGEQQAEHDRRPQALDQPLAVAVDQGVVRPGDGACPSRAGSGC